MKVKVRRGGTVELTLEAGEAEFVRSIPEQMQALYDAPPDDPARARLFPRAYLDPTEDRAEQEWEALAHPGMVRDRLDLHTRMVAGLDAGTPGRRGLVVTLDDEDLDAWVMVLNEMRLVIGSRLEVTEDTVWSADDLRGPDGPAIAAYEWLGIVQTELVEALLGTLPD